MRKKNILFILPDQMRADFLGCYGADFAVTPNIDQLAKEGVKFNQCISPSPLCVPARASLLTGFNSLRNGVLENNVWLRPDHEECGITTWPKQLSNEGYETIAVGKMHFYPWDAKEGFQRRIISEDKRHILVEDDYADSLAKKNLHKYHGKEIEGYFENKGAIITPFEKEDQADEWICDRAIEVLKEKHKKPFAMMVGFVSPHCPYDPNKEDESLFENKEMPKPIANNEDSNRLLPINIDSCKRAWNGVDYTTFTNKQKEKVRRHYCGLIHNIDRQIGKIIQSLKDEGLYDDTIIIFSSDHGDFVGDYGMVGKHFFYEPSIHVPLIIKDSDIKSGQEIENLVCLTDLNATLKALAGLEKVETEDSIILPIYSKDDKSTERKIFGASNIGIMVRTNEWMYCRYHIGLTQLFNLKDDLKEENNLAYKVEYLDVMKELDNYLQKQLMDSFYMANNEKVVVFDETFYKKSAKREYPHYDKQN
jgi:arylsulfatase A-like enzyme